MLDLGINVRLSGNQIPIWVVKKCGAFGANTTMHVFII